MRLLYTVGIYLYGALLFVAQFFSPKAKEWIKGRQNFWSQLPPMSAANVIWFHCASLGEFDQGLPLMKTLKLNDPNAFLLVTFFSPSGMNHYHKRNHPADFVCYLPLDTPSNARKFLKHFQPSEAYFVKYEFWANYIFEAKKKQVKLYSVSAIFREKQIYFKPLGAFFRRVLKQIDYFFVQTNTSLELLKSIGITKAIYVGDTRFDRVLENKANVTPDGILEVFTKGKKALVLGSTWPDDERMIAQSALLKNDEFKLIIAPHEIHENHLSSIEQLFEGNCIRYSQFTESSSASILILDSIGKLANAYSYGKIAYVGGGFSGNLHNILEPAVFALPVIFGPKHSRFPEAETFLNAGVGFSVATPETFDRAFSQIQNNYSELSTKISTLVKESAGASERISVFIDTLKVSTDK